MTRYTDQQIAEAARLKSGERVIRVYRPSGLYAWAFFEADTLGIRDSVCVYPHDVERAS